MKVTDLCGELKIWWEAEERLASGEVGFYWTDNPEREPYPFYSQHIKDWENLTGDEVESITAAVQLHRAFSVGL